MITKEAILRSKALETNLERTKTLVQIPDKYNILLEVAQGHYGVLKRTQDLLTELNHPYVNWEYVLSQLKSLSIGDYHVFSNHDKGRQALTVLSEIYLQVFRSADEEIKDGALRYFFEYLNTVLLNSDSFLDRDRAVLEYCFQALLASSMLMEFSLKKASTHLKTILKTMTEKNVSVNAAVLTDLFYQAFKASYQFWLEQPDPSDWIIEDGNFSDTEKTVYHSIVSPLSHEEIVKLVDKQDTFLKKQDAFFESLNSYLDMPDYLQILNGYLLIADGIERSQAFAGRQYLIKLNYLFNVMGCEGLAEIHNACLIEINRCLGKVFKEGDGDNKGELIRKVFALLKKTVEQYNYQNSIIDCITTLANGVFDENNHPLVDAFVEQLVSFGFQCPDVQGSNTEWQVKVNPVHVKNIRSWLSIIALKPRWTKKLLSALIINLSLKGVLVRDTDLLQKDISGLLNADIHPAYNLVKQLLRIFPIYFTEIGAEGELREISTRVDELTSRKDRLIYFLRKQSHVESNSLLVSFIENIFFFWHSGELKRLKEYLPDEVYGEVNTSGEYYDELHIIYDNIHNKIDGKYDKLLEWDEVKVRKEINNNNGVSEREKERAILMIRFYQLICKKYFHQHIDLFKDIEASCLIELAKIKALKRSFERQDYFKCLSMALEMLGILKGIILSPQKTTYFENIYYKRHIAAGIPSMYGTYREEKFEAMGLTFRLESFCTMLFEKLVESLNLKFITKSTLIRIHEYLWLYVKALDLEGISTEGLVSKVKYITSALQVRQFSIDQYIDIFQFISKGIQDITRDYYVDVHRSNLSVIVGQVLSNEGCEKGSSAKDQEKLYQYSESFIRSVVSSAFGLQVLDNLVNAIIRTLSAELEKFKDNKHILNLVMAYIPELAISPLYKRKKEADNPIMIGNKGHFLKELTVFGLPVPPGFIITTEVFRGYEAVLGYKYIFNDLSLRIYKELQELEKITGKKFGNPRNPLLLSVRSGATISLPGMMSSFLNVGINETIAEGLAEDGEHQWAAWDSYRRFLQTWGMFQGLERNFFDEIINSYKGRYGISKKIEFNPDQMRQIALSYKKAMIEKGIKVVDNPTEQLRQAILQVFASWDSEQARIYRHQMHLSDEWGTAVIVQTMVFGNLHENSGSGVFFTRDPKGSSQDVAIYGDFIFGVQGDDIVSGLVETYPISEKQRVSEKRDSMISLEVKYPEIYSELVRIAEMLVYEKGFNHQEIEFTFECATKKGLYILQTRDMVQRERELIRTFRDNDDLSRSLLGVGIGVSGGAITGRAVYSEEEILLYRKEEPTTPLILIRPDTVPDDVGIILEVEGILTARGGGTSHAAVTIPQLKKVGVVGFNKLHVYESDRYSTVDGVTINGGDFISIDGWSGAVYAGKHDIEIEESYKVTL